MQAVTARRWRCSLPRRGSDGGPREVRARSPPPAGMEDWREAIHTVHVAIDLMVAEGLVRLSWKGEGKPVRDGPYRNGRGGPQQ